VVYTHIRKAVVIIGRLSCLSLKLNTAQSVVSGWTRRWLSPAKYIKKDTKPHRHKITIGSYFVTMNIKKGKVIQRIS